MNINPPAMLSILHAMQQIIALPSEVVGMTCHKRVRSLRNLVTVVCWLPSELLTRQGEIGPAMFVVSQGRLSISINSPRFISALERRRQARCVASVTAPRCHSGQASATNLCDPSSMTTPRPAARASRRVPLRTVSDRGGAITTVGEPV